MSFKIIAFLSTFIFFSACQMQTQNPKEDPLTSEEDIEAREDSLELLAAYAAQEKINLSVTADVQTDNMDAQSEDDAADDPAIWVNPVDPSKTLVFGSNKKGGLAVFDLEGKEVAYYPIGKINNVEVLYDFPMGDQTITIVGCTNRTEQSINLFKLNPDDGKLENVAARPLTVDNTLIDDIYGFCFAQDLETKKYYAVINGKNGLMQQFELQAVPDGVDLKIARSVQFDSQTEGMVADNELGFLYVGEENKGIWKLAISPDKDIPKKFISDSGESNLNIAYDIEGLTLYKNGDQGLLIASSQGNFTYAVFDRQGDNSYITSFKIVDGNGIDRVEETDGLVVVSDSLSPLFPKGILVLQDGFNFEGETPVSQNFKYVSWEKVLKVLEQNIY